jgi:hypothetical protein
MRVIFEDKNLMMECTKIGWDAVGKRIYFSNGNHEDTIYILQNEIINGSAVIHKKGITTIPVKFNSAIAFYIAIENEIKDNGYVSIGGGH